jgi:hypothetical protein
MPLKQLKLNDQLLVEFRMLMTADDLVRPFALLTFGFRNGQVVRIAAFRLMSANIWHQCFQSRKLSL